MLALCGEDRSSISLNFPGWCGFGTMPTGLQCVMEFGAVMSIFCLQSPDLNVCEWCLVGGYQEVVARLRHKLVGGVCSDVDSLGDNVSLE